MAFPAAARTRAAARPPGSRAGLTRHGILEAALALVDREGASSLTMRRLGHELGVRAMSLYSHIAGRDELLDGLSEIMVEALPHRAAEVDWRRAIEGLAHGIRTTAKQHPDAFRLVGMRPLRTVNALAPVEAVLAALMAAGFGAADAMAAYRLVASYARGFALAEIDGFTLDANVTPPLPTAHPAVEAARATPGALDHDMAFLSGLDTILAGLTPQSCA